MTMKGADAVLKALEQEGVEVVFGIPGGASMPIYDPLVDRSPIRHVLCRHEQGAGHAAEGYAWATGKVGVCMATSGPGATNLVTPLTDAKMDSVPIVAITGQVPTPGRRQRRVPGGRHHRHHDAGDQAQLPREGPGGHRRDRARGVPHRVDRPPGPRADRPAQGRAERRRRVQVAREDRAPRLPPDDQGQQPPGHRGGQADPRGRAPRPLRGRRRDQGQRRPRSSASSPSSAGSRSSRP